MYRLTYGKAFRDVGELYIWLGFATLPLAQPFIQLFLISKENYIGEKELLIFISSNFGSVIVSMLIFFFPMAFKIIFGELPIRSLRRQAARRAENTAAESQGDSDYSATTGFFDTLDVKRARARVNDFNSHQLLSLYALESAKVAKNIQSRAGLFLLVGTIIAFSGLSFFYYYSTSIIISEVLGTFDRLLSRAPGIAILFFIEFVALFFLRLFKSTFDEYRYFDSIARGRENTLIALKIAFERVENIGSKDIIEISHLFSTAGRLQKDETTEVIESRKMQKDEIVLLEKLIDVIGAVKRK